MNPRMSEADSPEKGGGMPPQVRRVALGLAALWLALVAGVGGWASQR